MALAPLEFRHARFDWSRVYVAAVLNVTPDSFSDGGQYTSVDTAVAHGTALAADGADLIDVGGEATGPRAEPVDAATEIDRVVPVIERLAAEVRVPISIDTTKAEVARAALAAGAEVVNDVSGGLFEPDIQIVAAEAGAAYVCGHVRGTTLAEVHAAEASPPEAEEVAFELAARVARLPVALRHRTIVDPCLGFGKGLPQNLALTRWAGELARSVGCPVLIGPSRKRFVRALVRPWGDASVRPAGAADVGDAGLGGRALLAADSGTVGACLAAAASGAHIVRVHNIELLKPALMVYEAITGVSR